MTNTIKKHAPIVILTKLRNKAMARKECEGKDGVEVLAVAKCSFNMRLLLFKSPKKRYSVNKTVAVEVSVVQQTLTKSNAVTGDKESSLWLVQSFIHLISL